MGRVENSPPSAGSVVTGYAGGVTRVVPRASVRGLGPALAGADGYVQRDAQRGGTAHGGADKVTGGIELAGSDLDDELVVHLQEHPGLQPGGGERAVHGQHGNLDHVGGGALD